jgi:hypothetical protein
LLNEIFDQADDGTEGGVHQRRPADPDGAKAATANGPVSVSKKPSVETKSMSKDYPAKTVKVNEIAALSGLSEATVDRDVRSRRLASLSYCITPWYEGRYGKDWLCSEEQIRDWLMQRQRAFSLTLEAKTWLADHGTADYVSADLEFPKTDD